MVSPNPRAAVSYYLRTSDASGGNWSRVHGSAGTGIRPPDAFEIAFTDNPGSEAGAQQERRRRVRAGARGRPRDRGRDGVPQSLRRPDRRRRPLAAGLQPLPHRQHRERAGARRRDVVRPPHAAAASRRASATRSLDTEVLAVDARQASPRRPSPSATRSLRRPRHQAERRPALAAPAGDGLRARGRPLDACSTSSRTGARPAGCSTRRGSPSPTPASRSTSRAPARRARRASTTCSTAATRPSSAIPRLRRSFTVGVRLASGR